MERAKVSLSPSEPVSRVEFIEKTHQYLSEKGELISVSSFMKKFEPKKDWNAILKKKVKSLNREGIPITALELQKEWDLKKKLGTEAGTLIHKKKEDALLKITDRKIKHPYYEGTKKIAFPVNELENNTIYPELMIYDFEYMICGQSDVVTIENNTIQVSDYKTDKEIKWEAFSSQWVKPEKLLPPLSHLDNCNGNIYSLKMSLYMYLIWKANKGKLKPGKITLNWCPIGRDENGIPILYNGEPKILKEMPIEIPYRRKEVVDMLNTIKI